MYMYMYASIITYTQVQSLHCITGFPQLSQERRVYINYMYDVHVHV